MSFCAKNMENHEYGVNSRLAVRCQTRCIFDLFLRHGALGQSALPNPSRVKKIWLDWLGLGGTGPLAITRVLDWIWVRFILCENCKNRHRSLTLRCLRISDLASFLHFRLFAAVSLLGTA